MLILMAVMYLGTLFLCIYALKQWRECLVQWTESMAECHKLEDQLDKLEGQYHDWRDWLTVDDRDEMPWDDDDTPILIPYDLPDNYPIDPHNLL